MPQFLDLPRELRDMVYMAIITAEEPRPTLGEVQWLLRFRRVFEAQSSRRGEFGCSYSMEEPPKTCANFLQCNRQIYSEMAEIIGLARKRGMVSAKLDCIAEDESFHYFTWLAIPLVKTSVPVEASKSRIMPSWADRMVARYCAIGTTCTACRRASTSINQLRVDVRLFGDRSGKWFRNSSSPDRTSWAICAALKHVLEKGPDFHRAKDSASTTTVEELVLNIVTPPHVKQDKYLPEDFPIDGVRDGLVHPRTVAKELVDVWNKIWAGDTFRGAYYQVLIERITRVRVCIDNDTYRVRGLRTELERGQEERRRIDARGGW